MLIYKYKNKYILYVNLKINILCIYYNIIINKLFNQFLNENS